MEHCINHPDKKAEYVCHNCGNHYCELCITESGDYYYCKNPDCQKMLHDEPQSLPAEITCPNCEADLQLENDERKSRMVHCPECEALIDFTINPPIVKKREEYTHVFSSLNQGDISLIKSILDNAGIDYYVFGENFLSIDPLIQPARFFILNSQIDEAKELLKDFDPHIYGVSVRNSNKE